MIARIPANYRVSFKWLGSLDAGSAIGLFTGVVVSLKVLTGAEPVYLKVPEIAVSMGLGAAFGLFRYPLDLQGDRLATWVLRGIVFLRRDRIGSAFAMVVPPQARKQAPGKRRNPATRKGNKQ